ncbi:MAG: diguanylate cyclase [Acidimicrobiales bacterium]|nr:diguanylate cyclase [Acidimicrobiales bacterium]
MDELDFADQLITDDHLPTLPGVAFQLLQLCDDPKAGARDVAQVVRLDPSLVARVLQVVNSPFYAPRRPIVEIERAAAVLGLTSLKLIGLGFAVMDSMWDSRAKDGPLASIIGASAMAGSGARLFAQRIGCRDGEEAFVAGLLGYVGELSLAQKQADGLMRLWDEVGGLPSERQQYLALGVGGIELGERLQETWRLPDMLRTGVRSRALPVVERTRPSEDKFAGAVGFGTALADSLLSPDHDLTQLRVACRRWKVSDDDLGRYLAEFRQAVSNTYEMMGMGGSSMVDGLLKDARKQLVQSTLSMSVALNDANRELDELRAENQRLSDRVLLDPLTDLPNRAAFDGFLAAHVNDHVRHDDGRRVGVVLFDLDGFKTINDTLGHPAGDQALCSVAEVVRGQIRANELFARLGGDEFALVVPEATVEDLRAAGERLRGIIERRSEVPGLEGGVTSSVGVALLDHATGDPTLDAKRLIAAADKALYVAKRQGGNLCVAAS